MKQRQDGSSYFRKLTFTLTALTSAAGAFAACRDASAVRSTRAHAMSELVGAPVISNAFGLVPPLPGRFLAGATIAAVARGPGGYLLVYERDQGTTREIFGTRVLANGAVPDPEGVLLDRYENPDVATGYGAIAEYTIGHWLVVRTGAAIVVADNGRPTGRAALPPDFNNLAQIEWGGDRALVTNSGGLGRFLDANGVPLGEPFVLATPSPYGGINGGAVAFDGSHFLSVYARSRPAEVVVTSVAASGPTGHGANLYTTLRPSSHGYSGSLASNGSGFLATYSTSPPPCDDCSEIYRHAVAVSPTGEITLGPAIAATTMELVVANGNYLMWSEDSALALDASGNPLNDQPAFDALWDAFSSSSFGIESGGEGGGFLAFSGGATRVDENFAPLDAPLLTPLVGPTEQFNPAVAFDSENYLVTWVDPERGGLVGTRVSPSGEVLDDDPISIAPGVASNPVMASNGSDILVTWSGEGYFNEFAGATRWSPEHGKLPVTVPSGPTAYSVALASDGTSYLAVWGTFDGVGLFSQTLHAALVQPNGTLTNATDLGRGDTSISLAFDGEHYVAAWGDLTDDQEVVFYATRISRDSTLVDANPKRLASYRTREALNYGPRVVAGSRESLVVWTEPIEESILGAIRCMRLTGDLEIIAGSNAVLGEQAPSPNPGFRAAWDGTTYWVVWQSMARPGVVPLVGRRVAAGGTSIDAGPFEIALDADSWSGRFGLSPGRAGELLVVYEGFGRSHEIRARLLRSAPGGGGDGGAGGEAGASGADTGGTSSRGGTSAGGAPSGGTSSGGSSAGDDQGGEAGSGDGQGGSSTGGIAGRGGSAGTGADTGGESALENDDGGCDCSVARSKHERRSWALAVVASAWAMRRRRQSSRARSRAGVAPA